MSAHSNHRSALIHVLHMAYSGEKAAAYAYNAHWKSLKKQDERASIQRIEREELDHREIVGEMLAFLSAKPQLWRELIMAMIGRTVGTACFLIGWFLPMYFAGRLESTNVKEYDTAANHAEALGLRDFATELRRLSVVESTHELFFLEKVKGHRWLPLFANIYGWGLQIPESTTPK